MRYIDFLWALDMLYRCYPRYHTNEILMLAEDILKWFNDELPADSSALLYLQSCFSSPTEALKAVWKEIQVLAGPYLFIN